MAPDCARDCGVLLFGAKRLPELGKGLGEGLKGFKEGIKGVTDPAPPPRSRARRPPLPHPRPAASPRARHKLSIGSWVFAPNRRQENFANRQASACADMVMGLRGFRSQRSRQHTTATRHSAAPQPPAPTHARELPPRWPFAQDDTGQQDRSCRIHGADHRRHIEPAQSAKPSCRTGFRPYRACRR